MKSASLLGDKGVLSFVLPTELLQVNYSEEIREYLLRYFVRLEIVSFKSLAFEDTEQDTVLLIGYKDTVLEHGLFFSDVSDVSQLFSLNLKFENHHGDHQAKWSSYILTHDDVAFLEELSSKCGVVSDVCTSVAGIVTAANAFFIITADDVKKYNLEKYVKKIIQKGFFINGALDLSLNDYLTLSDNNKPCYLIDLNGVKEREFSKGLPCQNIVLENAN